MATATTATVPLSMKLLIDIRAQRVLFAEASKDVVDFLFSLLALPVGTVISLLLANDATVGSVRNLYDSVEDLDGTYVQPGAARDALLRPVVLSPAVSAHSSLFRLPDPSSGQHSKDFFKCTQYNNHWYVTDTSGTRCPICSSQMTTAVHFVSGDRSVQAEAAGGGGKGFVQGVVTYTVMDDLTVTPTSSISSITRLKTFAIKDLAALQEKTVQLGYHEGLAILEALLQSETVLTDVFLA